MADSRVRQVMPSLQVLLGILIVLVILYVAKAVAIPLAAAVLMTFVLAPIVALLQRAGLTRACSVFATVLLTLAAIGLIGYIVGSQIHNLAIGLPKHKDEIQEKLNTIRDGGGALSDLLQMMRELGAGEGDNSPKLGQAPIKENVIITRPEKPSSIEQILQAAVPVIEPLAHAGFVIILVVFMLLRREDLRNRFIGLLGDGRLAGTTRVIVDSAQRLSQYLLTQLLINVAFGMIFAAGLYVLGIEYAILWGCLTALMRFVPYIGSWIAVMLPFGLSFAMAPTWAQPISVLVFFGVIDLITANFAEPLLLGHRTGVSPIALLVAAAFWTWLWGPMGLVLSTPLTVCLVVIGQHVPRLRFFALLLGDQPPLKPKVRFYQRLLARDEEEATEVAFEYAKTEGLEKAFDNVLLPAVAMARRDRHDACLEIENEEFVVGTTRTIVDKLQACEVEMNALGSEEALPKGVAIVSPTESPTNDRFNDLEPRTRILGCPAHHQAEELAMQMLATLLMRDGCSVDIVSTKALPSEIEVRVRTESPDMVFISVLPPGGLIQARYLCKRLRRRFPSISIVVGYWGEIDDFDKLFRQVKAAGANHLATSLGQSKKQVVAMVHTARIEAPESAES